MSSKTSVVKSTVFSVGGNSYKIDSPKIGQIIDIEMTKAQITSGNYGNMVSNYNKLSIMSLDLIDMFSVCKHLCPELFDHMEVRLWTDLDGYDALDLYKAYVEQLKPWYEQYAAGLLGVWGGITDSLKTGVSDEPKEE